MVLEYMQIDKAYSDGEPKPVNPLARMPSGARFFSTAVDMQQVPLHEVNSALTGNFLSQILTSIGAALIPMTYSITQGGHTFSFALWPFGFLLFGLGAVTYLLTVYRARNSWISRRIPVSILAYNVPVPISAYNDSTQETKTIYP
jgi:hypothetical protein